MSNFDFIGNVKQPKNKTNKANNNHSIEEYLKNFSEFQEPPKKPPPKKQKEFKEKEFKEKQPLTQQSRTDDLLEKLKKNNKEKFTKEDYRSEKNADYRFKKIIEEEKLKRNLQNKLKKIENANKINNQKKQPEPQESMENIFAELFGESNLNQSIEELRREEEAKRKNQNIQKLLVGTSKPKFSGPLPKPSSEPEKGTKANPIVISDGENSDTQKTKEKKNKYEALNNHINPLKSLTAKRRYNFLRFSLEEIFENVLDFNFYHKQRQTEKVPDTFDDEFHYKYIWLVNFFNELKFSLLSEKAESNEVDNYIKMDVEVNFIFAGESGKISNFKLNTSKKLSELKKKVFKDNDIVAFYPNTKKINYNDIYFKAKDPEFFMGIIQIKNDNSYEIICKVHNEAVEKFELKKSKMFTQFKTYYMGSLTSPLREYIAILNLELSNFTGILYKKDLLNNTSQPSLSLSNPSTKTFIDNIQTSNVFNPSQTEAILKASQMKMRDILLIQGPPGTGKTHTILGLISLFLINNDGRILVCAPSNTAIDEISARIAVKGLLNPNLVYENIKFIRFGLYDRKEKENKYLNTNNGRILQQYSLEKLSDDRYKVKLAQVNSEIEDITRKINYLTGLKRRNVQEEHELVDLKHQRHNTLLALQEVKVSRKQYEYELISKTRILCTTLNSAGSERLKKMKIPFDYLIIDEACQCVEPSALIPLCHRAKKLVMVGDHMQLPATVFSDSAIKTLYNRSLFERLIDNQYPRHVLSIQYRMHPNIRTFIGSLFYENQIKDADVVLNYDKEKIYKYISTSLNFSFFDLDYGEERFDVEKGKSFSNIYEVNFVIKLIEEINLKLTKGKGMYDDYLSKNNYKYAIITPYKSQVRLFLDTLRNKKSDLINMYDIEVNTVDSFQGQERDIVIFSTVRSNFSSENENIQTGIGFLNDYRRMNVGLSRAKFCCFIVGNAQTLRFNDYWKKLIEFCVKKKSFFRVMSEKSSSQQIENIFIRKLRVEKCSEKEEGEVEENYSGSSNRNSEGRMLGKKRGKI